MSNFLNCHRAWLIGAGWLLVAACTDKSTSAPQPALPVTASAQGLSGAQRDSLHHLSEGDEFMPVAWLGALNSVVTGKPFLENIERFGMIADPSDSLGFPIGLSAVRPNDVGRLSNLMVGFSCAACHTSALEINGRTMIVDGGSGHSDPQRFEAELVASIDALKSPGALVEFTKRLHAQPAWLKSKDSLSLRDIPEMVRKLKIRMAGFDAIVQLLKKEPITAPGYGRIDAFGTARNMLYPAQGIGLIAPVRHPKIWHYYRHHWLHWDGNTNSVMERNIGQSLAAGAVYVPATDSTTLLPQHLHKLELLAGLIEPPKWPDSLAGHINAGLAADGRKLYVANCERCHALAAEAERDTLIPFREVGTDPQRELTTAKPLFGEGYAVVAGRLLKRAKLAAYADQGIGEAQQREIEGKRYESKWRVTNAYAARPLTGIWATAPYLHNGSVPTLQDLLLPPAQRPLSFTLGSRAYDPVKVGVMGSAPPAGVPAFVYDTRKIGNSNSGHLYGTTLKEEQRRALLEYLKTL